MHYSNGRAAKIGDLVRGKGYNLKHEFTGVLLNANAAATACNCTIGTAVPQTNIRSTKIIIAGLPEPVGVLCEYGQLDAFVALDPETGEVLPPEV